MITRRDMLTAIGAGGAGGAGYLAAGLGEPEPEPDRRASVSEVTSAPLVYSDRFTMKSQRVGDSYEISVARLLSLSGPTPERGRILYVLDGNITFASIAELARLLASDGTSPIESLLVGGIGYPVAEELLDSGVLLRIPGVVRDYSPPGTPAPEFLKQAIGADLEVGGADRFLRFIEEELDPRIRESYPAVHAKAGLLGGSYGGLFELYALFSRSPLFDRYIIGSPAVFGERDVLFDLEEARSGEPFDAMAYIALGELEQAEPDGPFQVLVANYHKLVRLLEERRYPGLVWSHEVLENETHLSAFLVTASRGLRRLYAV